MNIEPIEVAIGPIDGISFTPYFAMKPGMGLTNKNVLNISTQVVWLLTNIDAPS